MADGVDAMLVTVLHSLHLLKLLSSLHNDLALLTNAQLVETAIVKTQLVVKVRPVRAMMLHVVSRLLVVEEVLVRHIGKLAHISSLTQLRAVGAPAMPPEYVLVNVEVAYVGEGRRIRVRAQVARLAEAAQVLLPTFLLTRWTLQVAQSRILPLVILSAQYSLDRIIMRLLS